MTFELKDYRKGTKKIVSVIHSNDLLAKSHNRVHDTLYIIFSKLYSVNFFFNILILLSNKISISLIS